MTDPTTAHFDATVYGRPRPPAPTVPEDHTREINAPHIPRHFASPTPEQQPPHRGRRWPVFVLASVAMLLVVGATLYAATSRNVIALPGHAFEDRGVAACRVLAVSDDGNPAAQSSADSSKAGFEREAEQREALTKMRKMFNASHFDDIKNNGVALMDLAAQLIAPDGGATLLIAHDFITVYAGLSGACDAQGVPLKPLST